ncbi:MBOAT family protein [Lentimicrobium sp. L6]|uniref:MBOAT family O-acyltransferase n=1 Tax=Lentimicrobium sp. L6 TaxID=2735916 RepID=UPI00155566DF|nr:MBOAT family protein [Lentimicrobium sp. L6]NPD83638.1 MBOAT family protein [Lentimicrobium sp. L6]
MIFNSLTFALFLPIVFVLYWFVFNKNLKVQNLLLVVASYVFYGWWDWRFLSLIFISSISDYTIGYFLAKQKGKLGRKLLLWLSLAINLGFLGFFKYYNFFSESLIEAFRYVGIHLHESSLNIILPVGISFYTFQTLSYTIDIYRKKIEPTTQIISFFAFVSFFPQLVAGPIERASKLLPQFQNARVFNVVKAKDGLRQILAGLIKKVVIADTLAIQVDLIFGGDLAATPGLVLIFGAILFVFQIYGDFSGYTDIAIGTARLFGFDLMRNFAYPFFSRNINEFWQRWHISLSTWFRDYVFIPLGGSYCSKSKQVRNIIITFTISGFWHGANWTFVIWGFLNGLYYLPLLLSSKKRKYTNIVAYDRKLPSLKETLQILITFALFTFSMVFFRSASLSEAFSYLKLSVLNIGVRPELIFNWVLSPSFVFVILLIIVEWVQRRKQYFLQIENLPFFMRWTVYLLAIASLVYLGQFSSSQQFIYFQF